MTPARVMPAVPWMSSLKQHCTPRYFRRRSNALWFAKSSNCRTPSGMTSRTAPMNSSRKAAYSAPVARRCRSPLYWGSRSRLSLFVPTSRHTGRHWLGSTPAAAV